MAVSTWITIIGAIVGVFWFTWWLADRIDKDERKFIEQQVREQLQREQWEQWQQQQMQQTYYGLPPQQPR
jgi:hypothetical protein